MRHSKFFDLHPHADVRHFAKFTRQELNDVEARPSWLLRRLENTGDKLAFRAYILRHEGRETLVNIIVGAFSTDIPED